MNSDMSPIDSTNDIATFPTL